jgi:hypothetical protein
MAPDHRSFPFRWILPSAQLVVCLALLWPVRGFILFDVMQSIRSYSSPTAKSSATSDSKEVYAITLPRTPDEQRRVDAAAKLWETRRTPPLALNFPVLIAQLPYILVSPTKREWVPKGMSPDVWRPLSWPFAGMFFWWLFGRSVEALSAARRSLARPQINWVETTFALILFGIGLVTLIGILTSTPDDRRDIQFMALIAGGLLWGILATATIAARFLQRRIVKRSGAAQSTSQPSPG